MNNKSHVAPCKDCTKRELGCHSNCGDYIQFKIEKERINENRRQFGSRNNLNNDYRGLKKAYRK